MAKKTDIMKGLKAYDEYVEKTIKVGDQDMVLKIKTYLTPSERAAIVSAVAGAIIVDDERNYGLLDYAFKLGIIRQCTDLKVTLTEKEWAMLVYKTDIFNVVSSVVGCTAVAGLMQACDSQIKEQVDSELTVMEALAKPDPLGRIAAAIEGVTDVLKEKVGDIDISTLKALISGAFSGEDEPNLIHADFGKEDENAEENASEQTNESGTDSTD